MKGDSIIVMAINATSNSRELKISLPYVVKSGTLWLSTGNETANLCQKSTLDIPEPTDELIYQMPAQSLNTYIFTINGSTAIQDVKLYQENSTGWHTLDGISLNKKPTQKGVYIHNGKKVVIK